MKLIAFLTIITICFYGKSYAEDIDWTVLSGTSVCLLANMNIKANFSYKTTDSQVKNILYEIPNNLTKVNTDLSACNKTDSLLTVDWLNGNRFEVSFINNNKTYELSSFKVTLNTTDIFKDSSDNSTVVILYQRSVNDSSFETPSNFSFHCNREQILNSTIEDGSYIILSKVQFETFRGDNKEKKFSLAKDCESNFKPDIVPIAVGFSLIALIIIVLIAYIVGRRRQQARGYLNIM